MLLSMAHFGLLFLGYLLRLPVMPLLAVRALHTFFGGADRPALAAVVTYGVVNAVYPFVRSVWVLVGLGFFEGAGLLWGRR